MKRIWNHPEVKSERRYWRSLGEYQQTPEFTEKLGREFDPGLAKVVELRYFAGLSELEIAALLERSERSIRRDWQKARLFLLASLKDD